MKLHWSPRSPFVRKVVVVMHELGVAGQVEFVRTVVPANKEDEPIFRDNPLGMIPALIRHDGGALYDSYVICEWLAARAGDERLVPADAMARIEMLRLHALANGIIEILVRWHGERLALPQVQIPARLARYAMRTRHALRALESELIDAPAPALNLAWIAAGCALAYLDFRFDFVDWRKTCPALEKWHAEFERRPSVLASQFANDT